MINNIINKLPKRELAKSVVDIAFDKYDEWNKNNSLVKAQAQKQEATRLKETAEIKKQLNELMKKLE